MTNTYLKVVNNIEKMCTSRPVDYNANSEKPIANVVEENKVRNEVA